MLQYAIHNSSNSSNIIVIEIPYLLEAACATY